MRNSHEVSNGGVNEVMCLLHGMRTPISIPSIARHLSNLLSRRPVLVRVSSST